jgi:hypothetical protein
VSRPDEPARGIFGALRGTVSSHGDIVSPAVDAEEWDAARDDAAALRWEVWRQDDNGVRLRVDRFPTREAAEARIAEFEAHHHRQMYWIEEAPPQSS